jgi:hypothetical protein
MANLSHITRCGLPGIEWVPCTDQLVAALVPYAIAGLQDNERSPGLLRRCCRRAKPFRRCAPRATTSTTPSRRVQHPRLGPVEGTRRRAVIRPSHRNLGARYVNPRGLPGAAHQPRLRTIRQAGPSDEIDHFVMDITAAAAAGRQDDRSTWAVD